MDSFDMACSVETQHLTHTFSRLNPLLYFLRSVYLYLLQQRLSVFLPPNRPDTVLSVTVHCTMERCRSIVSMLQEKQVWCNSVVILEWQIDSGRPSERGERVEWCHWQTAMTSGVLWPPECKAHTVFTSGQHQREHAAPPPPRSPSCCTHHIWIVKINNQSEKPFVELDAFVWHTIWKGGAERLCHFTF